jgi:transcriptional regulator with XRE-family HTH domain
MSKNAADPVLRKAEKLFKSSGKTLEEVGKAMGYPPDVARRAVWQFLNKVPDPRVSTLRRFAKAIGVGVKDLF